MRSMSIEDMERALDELDGEDMVAHVRRFPEYLKRSGDLVAEAPDPSGCGGVAVAGMGGSGIVGEVLTRLCEDELDVPVVPVHDYDFPRYVDEDWFFVSVSYSGNTEETVSAHREAVERGCETLAVTSGGVLGEEESDHEVRLPEGFPPRAALPQLLAPLVGVANGLGADLDLPAAGEAMGDVRGEALSIAEAVRGSTPVVYGYGALEPAAYRWKCQFNENAKTHAFWNAFPELNHNEAEGWPSADGFTCVLLRSDHGRMEERVDATLSTVLSDVETVESRFGSGLDGALSAVHLGDWVSLYLAAMRGVDPTPVDAIEEIKRRLG